MRINHVKKEPNTMYYLELRYTNGKVIRLPEPYFLWQEANRAALQRVCAQYTVCIVQD